MVNTRQYAQECLDAHNDYRARHGSPPLVLSEWLMGVAQSWANNCAARCQMYHTSVHEHPNDGENIYGTYTAPVHGREPADCFYKEQQIYRPGMGFTMQTGHFTMMVWKNVKLFGLGMATGRNGLTYIVVSYSPRGNGGAAGTFEDNVLPLGTRPPQSVPKPLPSAPSAPTVVAEIKDKSKDTDDDVTSTKSSSSSSSLRSPFVTKAKLTPTNKSFKSYSQLSAMYIVNDVFNGTLGDCIGNRLEGGQHMSSNQYMKSTNGKYMAILQDDGNFALYNRERNGWSDWATNTRSYDTARNAALLVQLRNDGFVTVVDGRMDLSNPIWTSQRGGSSTGGGSTAGDEGCYLILQDDGNLVAYNASSKTAYFSAK